MTSSGLASLYKDAGQLRRPLDHDEAAPAVTVSRK
jgi:hypothetical protein